MFTFLRKNEKGFTLVEVLVVVIIVALLAAIAVPIYLDYVEDARSSEPRAVIDAIKSKMKVYYQRYGYYPKTIEEAKVTIDEAVEVNWQFDIVGGGNEEAPTQIKATSTDAFPGKAGKEVIYNWSKGKWEGYGAE